MATRPDALPEQATREILAWLHQAAPERLLLVGPPDSSVHRAARRVHPDARELAPEQATPEALGGTVYDLAVITQTLERLPRRDAGMLLSRLRDLHAKRFLALVQLDGGWSNTDLIAYGMKRCGRFPADYALYRYNIYDYKDTPDWLNARYWAHPERWGKERW